MTNPLMRWPTEDPRCVLVGTVWAGDWRKGDVVRVRLIGGALAGRIHCSAQAGTDLAEGELVALRGCAWERT